MSLISLAQKGLLPKIQHMDNETLKWIESNRPDFAKTKQIFSPQILNQVKKYFPAKQWFLEKSCIGSIHGLRHILRVVANASNLIIGKKINFPLSRNLLVASSLHDLRRKNDKGDKGHADRARKQFLLNAIEISKYYNIIFSNKDKEEISNAIYFHEIPYSQIRTDERYLKHKMIIDLLKTADALDRYRLPKLKWWINDDFLRLIPDKFQKQFAFNLVINSEKKYLFNGNSTESVLNSLTC